MPFTPRPHFPYPNRIPSWYAGHMVKSLRRLPALLEDIDLVIEARDARLPLTSINTVFDKMLESAWGWAGTGKGKGKDLGGREKIVVYTKRDLAEERYEEPLRKAFMQLKGEQIMFADTRIDGDVKKVLRHAVRIAKINHETMPEMRILVVGMPNVGKSSLLNAHRRVGVGKGKVFRVGAEAGVTRKNTGTVRIYEDPSIYVYDTPGVMVPWLGRGDEAAERGLKYAITAGIKEDLWEQDVVVDYLLWRMNQKLISSPKEPNYLSLLPLPPEFTEPTNDISSLLTALAKRLGALKKGGEVNDGLAQAHLLRMFREGKLGRWTLDELEDVPLFEEEVGIGRGEGEERETVMGGNVVVEPMSTARAGLQAQRELEALDADGTYSEVTSAITSSTLANPVPSSSSPPSAGPPSSSSPSSPSAPSKGAPSSPSAPPSTSSSASSTFSASVSSISSSPSSPSSSSPSSHPSPASTSTSTPSSQAIPTLTSNSKTTSPSALPPSDSDPTPTPNPTPDPNSAPQSPSLDSKVLNAVKQFLARASAQEQAQIEGTADRSSSQVRKAEKEERGREREEKVRVKGVGGGGHVRGRGGGGGKGFGGGGRGSGTRRVRR